MNMHLDRENATREFVAAFTVFDVVAKVREIVAANPDFIYVKNPTPGCSLQGSCDYVHNGKPDCLMAKALHALGTPVHVLAQCEGMLIRGVLGSVGVDVRSTDQHQRAGAWLRAVQSSQDDGNEWGQCVEHADVDFPIGE